MTLQKNKRYAVVDETHCVACGSCMKVCPKGAITIPCGITAKIDTENVLAVVCVQRPVRHQ